MSLKTATIVSYFSCKNANFL